ncbi:major histocompatibility complex class I-related gene protein-like [Chanos chanos]|uniref:Major histocompatibility complex class I-related gene protein-like n=1 Tax=Chanos chanos TaxID=29144 RepID=A0A6J2UNR8_CHACN|nr:major histocompatibility complex class I-related gene protein-like [Chanos chanos]
MNHARVQESGYQGKTIKPEKRIRESVLGIPEPSKFILKNIDNAGSHSLYILATYIQGETQFPEFSVVIMLDDVQEQMNSTNEFHVHQRLAGCELLENGISGDMMTWDAFNGVYIGELRFSTQQNNIHMKVEHFGLEGINPIAVKLRYTYVHHPICIQYLKRYLQEQKNRVRRKVKPRLRLLKKTLTGSAGIQVTCLATGFYPRHISLTLLRDGQPVSEDQITGGILLPNGDDTYQMRKSVEVSAEELRVKRNYTCMVTHLSLDNKLDISIDYDPDTSTVSVVSLVLIVLAAIFVLTVVPTAGFIAWWRRRAGTEDNSTADSLSLG